MHIPYLANLNQFYPKFIVRCFLFFATLVKGSFPSTAFPESTLFNCRHTICFLGVVIPPYGVTPTLFLPFIDFYTLPAFTEVGRASKSYRDTTILPAESLVSSYLSFFKNKFIVLDNCIGRELCNNVKAACRASDIMDFFLA